MDTKGTYTEVCANCNKTFSRQTGQHPKNKLRRNPPRNWTGGHYCSVQCFHIAKDEHIYKPCGWCGEDTKTSRRDFLKSKSGHIFCDRSCAAKYNNTKRRKSKRSKCEELLFDLMSKEFPNLEIVHNDKNILDGYECDIAIPELKLGIEWNGIVHYKPIWGEEKLDSIQQRDKEKQLIAERNGIHLIVIPDLVSTETYVIESFQKIKQIIKDLVAKKD